MVSAPVYQKPPVREGIIDIRISPLPSSDLPKLEALHDALKDIYPVKKVRQKLEGFFEFKGGALASGQRHHGIIGYQLESADKTRIVQFRLDGFTLNYLKPRAEEGWPGWPSLRDEGRKRWEQYFRALSEPEITRIAVRYVNQIVIHSSMVDLDDYLTTAPGVSKKLPYQHLEDFLSRVTVKIPELNASATITQAPAKERRSDAIVILLDIDVFRNDKMVSGSAFLWEILDQFRDVKNTIFEASLNQKAKDLFL